MQDTSKYLIHADITADGVVERSDVVGAIFGQTEGLLGEDLDLRSLQESSKVGRIDVEIDSENGQSFGTVTIASGLDQVETAILAASLETIDRIGPCRASLAVAEIEDVRTAKRREVVERAKALLEGAFEGRMSSEDIVAEVRRSVRVADVTEYEGLPAGPRVADGDAIIVVEGRADVLTLLEYGVKNAIAVEGTNVPDAVAELTHHRTTTAFLDGDRGGDLILKELGQVGDIDHVALAPPHRAVEDLDRREVLTALREKVLYESLIEADGEPLADVAATDGSTRPAPMPDDHDLADPDLDAAGNSTPSHAAPEEASVEETDPPEPTPSPSGRETLRGHVAAVVGDGSGTVRLLDDDFVVIDEAPAESAFEAVRDAEAVPATVVLDGTLDQRTLDVAAQRGVGQVVTRSEGDYVKKPTAVRIRPAGALLDPDGP